MPYSTNSELPDAAKKLSAKKQDAFRQAFNSGYAQHKDETVAFKIAWAAANQVKESDPMKKQTVFIERVFNAEQRKKAAKSGAAMSDGSFPIENTKDLSNAIRAIGRAKNPAAAKAHIKTRAKALGATSMLPDDWKSESESFKKKFGSLILEADGVTPREDSFDAIRSRVQCALDKAVRAGEDMDCDGDDDSDQGCYCWIRDLFPDCVVYQMDGDLFQVDYQDDGEMVMLGKPFEVEMSYTAATDETPDEEDESFKESAAHTAAAKTMVGNYVQDKSSYGSSGIYKVASVDEKKGSATLHGPIGKGGSKTVSHKDLVDGHMDLGASDQLSQVYAAESFRESFHQTGDSRRVQISSLYPIQEAAYDASKGLLTLTVIRPGLNKSGERYYPANVLKRDHHIFEGAKMFVNHQTDRELKERPEGDINNWAATMKKVWAESDGTIKGQAAVIDPALKGKLEELSRQNMLSDMGVSIRALGESTAGEISGKKTNIVESLLRARSVDFVTYAGAGGKVEMLESERIDDETDVSQVSEAELRRLRPDLVQLIESQHQERNNMSKTAEQYETEIAGLKAELVEADKQVSEKKYKAMEKEVVELKAQIQEAAVKEQKATAYATLIQMLKESKLPEAAQKRLQAKFKDAVNDEDFQEAISEEKDYIKSIGGRTEVRDFGELHNSGDGGKQDAKKKMQEAFARFGPVSTSASV